MKGQLISDWVVYKGKTVPWITGFITIRVKRRFYGRLPRTGGIFVDVELES